MGARCVYACVSCSVSFCMCMCVGLRVLWLPSVTCVGHVLSLPGWGRRSRETAEHKGETQAGRQAAGRQPARAPGPPPQGCSGCGGWSLGLDWTCYHGVPVFSHVLTHTHASLVPSLTPNPTISHPQATLMPLPKWFSLKTNLHPSSVASIHKTSSHSGKRFPTLGHLRPPLPQPDHQTQKRNIPFRALP